jgi:hypothetical protein
MNSIFETKDNEVMIARVNNLTSESKALWGKMSVDQMLKHTAAPIAYAQGSGNIKGNFFLKLLGSMMKNKILNNEFKKNSPTAPEFIFKESYDFEASKKDLIEKFSQFTKGEHVIKVFNHPFFGKMSTEDWNKLMWSHLDHHLRQFGV